MKLLLALLALLIAESTCYASIDRPTVYFAGLSYAGSNGNIESRFPFTRKFELEQNSLANLPDGSKNPSKMVFGTLKETLLNAKPRNYDLSFDTPTINGNDQVILLSLVIGNEITSIEPIGDIYKLFTQIRGQVLFFDIKAMRVLKSYPISFAYLDVKKILPTQDDINTNIKKIFLGAENKPGIFSRFASVAASAQFSQMNNAFLQVTDANLDDSTRKFLPEKIRASGLAEEWLADMFGESISKQLNIPILPYKKNDTIGKMEVRLSDGANYSLQIPPPDYLFKINLLSLKRITDKETDAAIGYVYGSVANVVLNFPVMGKDYLNSKFKYGKPVVMPRSDMAIDDETSFSESIQGLFDNISLALNGNGPDWSKQNSLPAPNSLPIQNQISLSAEILKKCK
ncbi:MAG: hypothetical protein WDM70_10325 [Nitrosomonadales bacterium]